MTSGTSSKKPNTVPFEVAPHLSRYSITMKDYLKQHTHLRILAVGVLVRHEDRVLIVQRSKEERAYPNVWEIPGGSCESMDETILHGAARELYEEAGLTVSRICDQVTEGHTFWTGTSQWLKLTFLAEVQEAKNTDASGFPAVKLDPEEHQDYAWVTKQQALDGHFGDSSFGFLNETQKRVVLQGFNMVVLQ
ncbi:hypothetical protein K402DRAFT_420283 [Aulographum hederae CBS 113979]|uniref:Nudix hydrolase domain-containing protein n=1 Tax=Aulographum hederae CBS 113979 TaxID=1176131 RepID=A0A6G1H341_9PEZI|nr:hypothetical protein K402DRAFT_420283 [Aulographum hederae CBS 113979]